MQHPEQEFEGRVVLVTGGTQGIGLAIAEAFLQLGATVIVCGRTPPAVPPQARGRTAEFMACDVRDTDAVRALPALIAARHRRLDLLINNAGGAPPADAASASPRFHERILQLNLIAPLHLSQAANALMQKQADGGVIIFIGSVSALRPSPGTAAYGAAKAGVLSLMTSLAVEWAPKVRLMAVSPGPVRTDQTHLHFGTQEGLETVCATVPAGRLAEPADVANACLFLASPRASYISGSNLVLHGGGERPAFLAVHSSAYSDPNSSAPTDMP